ncbi:hypothetical protein [Ferdinandcohnia sp. SAFN-114]|uniref:hypothetical protein n=1 Tax=Ferdinandcohnia sp. SAFN-114 TaxID=3387275 RepID=UPI003F808E94
MLIPIEVYLIIYLILEQFVLERTRDLLILHRQEFFESVNGLESNYSSKQEVSSLAPTDPATTVDPIKAPIVSVLDGQTLDFLSLLEQEVGALNVEKTSTPIEARVPKSYDDEIQFNIGEDDCLSINDLNSDALNELDDVNSRFVQYATAKIKDEVEGRQEWTVKVIGMEGPYIHITDGQRIWVNVGEAKTSKIHVGDVLNLDVARNGKKDIIVNRIIKLETSISDEYMIPDEHYNHEERIAI